MLLESKISSTPTPISTPSTVKPKRINEAPAISLVSSSENSSTRSLLNSDLMSSTNSFIFSFNKLVFIPPGFKY